MKHMNNEEPLHRHVFVFNPNNNGGESLSLVTEFFKNYASQNLSLQSYGNSATFNLDYSIITPDILRKLANELETANLKANNARTEKD
jgi:hypothetical protein